MKQIDVFTLALASIVAVPMAGRAAETSGTWKPLFALTYKRSR